MDIVRGGDISLPPGEVFYILYVGQKLDPVILTKLWLKCKEWVSKDGIKEQCKNVDITNYIESLICMVQVNSGQKIENKKGYITVLEAMVRKFIYKENENV